MKKLGLALLAALIIMQAEALLPPLYQTSGEIKAIMSDDQLGQKLQSGEVIEKIEKNDYGYEITTNKSHVQVSIVYEHATQPGPAHYKIYFSDPAPISFE